jgi:hypothetical protein
MERYSTQARLHSDGTPCNCKDYDTTDPTVRNHTRALFYEFHEYTTIIERFNGSLKKVQYEDELFDKFEADLHIRDGKRVTFLLKLHPSYYLSIIEGKLKFLFHTHGHGTFVIEPLNTDTTTDIEIITLTEIALEVGCECECELLIESMDSFCTDNKFFVFKIVNGIVILKTALRKSDLRMS